MENKNHYRYENEMDTSVLWLKDTPPVLGSGAPRLRSWMVPALMAAVLLVLIVVLGVYNSKKSERLASTEGKVSNLTDTVQSLSVSLLHAQETIKDLHQLKFSVENQKEQLTAVSDALKHLSVVDSLVRSVAELRSSLNSMINNDSAADRCSSSGWTRFGSSCYFFSRVTLSWNESKDWCEKQNAHLVIISTDGEWDFVTKKSIPVWYWVGLSDGRTGKWEWVNHTPYTIEQRRWRPGQPDNWVVPVHGSEDCAHLYENGLLNDLHCYRQLRFICQRHEGHM
ncbi:C-type lectin domain family 10 member A [Oryzias melastigma]|uniref:C-type lectin domain family 10 member A-like n=1 Tax=Oryzias melastigma TaxID=30732 RepID=A0A3B3D608_ORYME|nr:C-type lectin domain family 10 member A [Oryzias melastigma]